jgi:hypothetical protein
MPVWWGFVWRSLVYMAAFGMILGIITILLGVPYNRATHPLQTLVGYIAYIPLSMLALKNALEDQFPKLSAISNPPTV